jgi:hypothetical protein
MADKKPAADAPTPDASATEPTAPEATQPPAAAPVAPTAPTVKAPAPAKAEDKKPAADAPAEKLVMLLPSDSLKHVITFGGHPRLFIKPGAPTTVTPKTYEELREDVGFNNLVNAGKISVLA